MRRTRDVGSAKVKAGFDKSKSWVKDTTRFAIANRVQQMRFDLYEVFARKFNVEIDEIRNDPNTRYEDLEAIGETIYDELRTLDQKIFESPFPDEEILRLWRPAIDSVLYSPSE